jgi:PAT family beta-lactamase induction signal transducer AmpG
MTIRPLLLLSKSIYRPLALARNFLSTPFSFILMSSFDVQSQHAFLRRLWCLFVTMVLGFASGLPLALTGQALQAWLSAEKVDITTIGFLSLVGLPYTFKFLWAPLMDRFELSGWGRRRVWLAATQLALALALWALAATSPQEALQVFAALAACVAFASASQDVIVDAYRTELLDIPERGLGSSTGVLGYRLAMILSGGVAFIWTDPFQGGGWRWPEVYRFMALLMIGLAVFSITALPRLRQIVLPHTPSVQTGWQELTGFFAVLTAVVVGYQLTHHILQPCLQKTALWILQKNVLTHLEQSWLDLVWLLLGLGITLPLAIWAAHQAKFETLLGGLRDYFNQPSAVSFLIFIVLYKLGDAFAGSLMTPFLLQGMAYTSAEVGVVNKILGLWLTISGALLGGTLMLRLGLWCSLLGFGALQMLSNLGFWWLAVHGKGAMPNLLLPAFDWGFVKLLHATQVDGGLLMVVAFENLSGGMGTAAFVAFLMSLCNRHFTATQYALLSAFAAVGRVWVGPLAGVLATSIGWSYFFLISTIMALPALGLLWWLKSAVKRLDISSNLVLLND